MPKKKLPAGHYSWTPKLSYAIGLLVTDGCLSSDGRHIIMRSKDKCLLKTYNTCVKKSAKISSSVHNGRICYTVQPSDVQFYRWLLTIGLFPRKTYTIGAINIPPRYFRDFLRGHLDGDGSITVYTDRHNVYKNKRYINTRVYVRLISVSQKHILWLCKMMHQFAPAQGALIRRKGYNGRVDMWEIKMSKYDSLRILKWLYYRKDLPCLQRKRKIAERVLRGVHHGKLIRL